MAPDTGNLIWIDLEMTGLNPDVDYIIEIATVITNASLEVLAEGPELAVRQSAAVLDAMDEWNAAQHTRSGLVERVRCSPHDEADAARLTLDFVRRYVPEGVSPMCGNSICQDRRFMHRWMPDLERYFHYRHIDVSTLKELCSRWSPDVACAFSKESSHRALADIHDSIAELKHYRDHFMNLG